MSYFSSQAEDHVSSALQAALRPGAVVAQAKPGLIVAGATGALGSEVLRRLAGSGRFSRTQVLAKEPITTGLLQVGITLAAPGACDSWPVQSLRAQIGVVMFEPPRLYHDRERALWTPGPEQLLGLARWLGRCGVQTLVVVMPHAEGRLPEALKRGLANLDEQAVSTVGFERLLLVRSARKKDAAQPSGFLTRTAAWMLSTLSYMIPATERPIRPAKLAEFVDAILPMLPAGTHVAPPELLWQFAQGQGNEPRAALRAWLNTTRLD